MARTYSDFERVTNEAISPSMYEFMSKYVRERLEDVNESDTRQLDEDAVWTYFSLAWQERERLHREMLTHLDTKRTEYETKLKEIRQCDLPFDPSSFVYHECRDFLRSLETKTVKKLDDIERMIVEEECWRSGVEDAESDTEGPRYDHMDEI
jgi:hypothetical protein